VKGYKPENISNVNIALMKVIKTLPYQNNMIYSDNLDIMEGMLKI
jgi:hypothetical protein